jgi:AraC-like DNA-binding protein
MTGPAPVDRDSRGILDPWLLQQRVSFSRHGVPTDLHGIVDFVWAVRWSLPAGGNHRQEVLPHPSLNVSVGTPDARTGRTAPEALLNGVFLDLVDRELAGVGWTVAAKSTVGGFGAFVGDVTTLRDRVVPVATIDGLDASTLLAAMGPDADHDDVAAEPHRVTVLVDGLRDALTRADPARVEQAREVAAVARLAETDREVRRLDDLAARAGIGGRSLQRSFARCAGVSPTWVIRRYRLLEAAEAVRDGARVRWTEVAGALGYADQAHLVRDFRAALGRTPEAYARAVRRDR